MRITTHHWEPPARPAWVEHLNAMGLGLGDPKRLVSLDGEEMIACAVAETGLVDFGPDSWREHYGVLTKTIDETAKLHVAGRLLTRSEIVRCLRNRLFVESYLAANPEALDTPVLAPLVVCGFGRSGTSLTQRLLALDDNCHAPLAWELFDVSPQSEGMRADRVRFAGGEQLFFEDIVPAYRAMHENGAELPVECLMFQMHEFLSAQYFGTMNVPEYALHAAKCDWTSAYRYEYRLLQVLQHQRPGKRWVLKSPTHHERMDVLFKVFPDALVVQLHRDPLKMIPSSFSLMGTLRWMRSDEVDLSSLAYLPASLRGALEKVIRQKADGVIPAGQVFDLLYADLMNDPVESLRACYAYHDLDFSAHFGAAIQKFLTVRPKGMHGRHGYELADFGLDSSQLGELFSDYLQHYGVPTE